jgi:ABC-type antimicrobial peptide transport system permease subunit
MRVPGNTAEMQVVGISDFPLDQVWIDWRTLARISGYTVGAPRPNEYLTTVTVEGFEGDQGDNQVAAIGLDTQLAGFVTFEAGEFFTPGEPGVIISAEMAERGGISAGDTLTLTSSAEGGETVEVPVTGVFQIPPMLRTEDIPTDVIGMDWRALAELEGRSIEGEPLPQIYFLITSLEDPTADELDHVINQINEMLLNAGIPAGFLNFVELTDEISTIFATFQAILSAVAGLIALVGALGLLTTLSMSVFERQKEIGVMRSIGAGSLTVATQFLTEGLVVGVIAWLVGLPLALLIEVLLLEITGLGDTFPLTFPVTAAVVGLIGMLIITTIASLWPSLAAARKTVSDILRYQ